MSEKTRIAVPSNGEGGLDGERSAHFGSCDCFTLFDIQDGEIVDVTVVENPPHEHGGCLRPVGILAGHGVNAIVAAGMGGRPLAGFNEAGIDVYFENQTESTAGVMKLLLEGSLPVMDGRNACGGH